MRCFVAGVIFLFLFASNAYALGDGYNVNGLEVKPTITLDGEYNDNITRSTNGKAGSWVTVVTPALDVTAGGESSNITLHYDLSSGNDSRNIDSYTDHTAGGGVHKELTHRAVFDATASYHKGHDSRGTTFTGIVTGFNTPDKWHETAVNAQFSYGGQNAKGRLVFDGSFTVRRYDNHRVLTVARDLNTGDMGVIFYYRLMPKTSALLEGRYTSFDYRLVNSPLASNEASVLGGLTWDATARTSGTIKVGWQRKKFRRGTQTASNNLSWDVLIDWSPMTYSTWTFSSGYQADETDGTGAFIKSIDVNLTWDHAWNSRLKHVIDVSYTHDQFVGTLRRDNTVEASIGLSYALASWLDIATSYDYEKRTSNVGRVDFTQNVYSLTLTGSL